MPTADQHPSSDFVRLLLMGVSGTGKTGALLSLLQLGYKIRVVDMDNGLDWLINKLKKDHRDLLPNLSFMTFRDKVKMTAAGPQNDGVPNAYTKAVQALGKWEDGTVPAEWGPEHILVLDSLTFFGNSAFAWKDAMTPPSKSGFKDTRQIYGAAQDAVSDILDAVTSPEFKTNVIVNTHVRWKTVTDEKGNTTIIGGGPSSIGEALTDRIGTYFNTVGLCEQIGSKRQVRFEEGGLIALKTSAVSLPAKTLPLETGLATFFKAAKGS